MPGPDDQKAAQRRMMAEMSEDQRTFLDRLFARTPEMSQEQQGILAQLRGMNTDFEILNAHTNTTGRPGHCGCGVRLTPVPPPETEIVDRYLARHGYCCLNYYATRFNRDHVVGGKP